MNIKRLFDYDEFKGTENYLKIQSRYEIAITLIYICISLSLLVGGIVATGDKMNLLTMVAILGCLPACKSAVSMVMFLRYKGCSEQDRIQIKQADISLTQMYDLVFTTYDKNFVFSHGILCGNTVILYSAMAKLDEQACVKHLQNTLTLDGIKNTVTFKIFYDLDKYLQRAAELEKLEEDTELTAAVRKTLLSVAL